MKYRSDIDGLRSLAIVPVMLYHFNFPFVGGGFLGVDVFFVISGFLITSLIQKEIVSGHFSIAHFYQRRVLRIFPALFAVLLFSMLMGYFYLLPKEFERLGESVAATTLFGSNIIFFFQDNYFDAASGFKPLLHTWSLAVEEQFYLVFPIFLIFLGRMRDRRLSFGLMAGIGLLSLMYNIWALQDNRAAAFYLPMARAWELLAGAAFAYDFVPPVRSRRVREILGVCGIAMIVGSVVFLNESSNSFCPVALWACVGSALIIYSGATGTSSASRLLSNPVLVYIGKISYSLYLWHWPLLVFYRLEINSELHLKEKSALLVSTFIAAALSTRFIERPFRRSEWVARQRVGSILATAVGVLFLFVVAGLSIDATGGFASRFPPRVIKIASVLEYGDLPSFRTDSCFLSSNSNEFRHFAQADCLKTDPQRKNVLIVGDSHAAELWSGLASVYPEINFLQATVAGCAPIMDFVNPGPFSKTCRSLMDFIFKDYMPHHPLDGVIVAARWEEKGTPGLEDMIKYILQYEPEVTVIGPSVEYLLPLPRILAFSILKNDPEMIVKSQIVPNAEWDGRLRSIVEGSGGNYISMRDSLCRGQACTVLGPDDIPMEFDNNHLSEAGARVVAARWKDSGWLKTR